MCFVSYGTSGANPRFHKIHHNPIYDEYIKKTLEGRLQKKEKTLKVFDHQIHQKLATDVIGVSFDAQ